MKDTITTAAEPALGQMFLESLQTNPPTLLKAVPGAPWNIVARQVCDILTNTANTVSVMPQDIIYNVFLPACTSSDVFVNGVMVPNGSANNFFIIWNVFPNPKRSVFDRTDQ